MKYSSIKAAKISHAQIAKAFGFANVKSFNTTSAHKRYMQGVEAILKLTGGKATLGEKGKVICDVKSDKYLKLLSKIKTDE